MHNGYTRQPLLTARDRLLTKLRGTLSGHQFIHGSKAGKNEKRSISNLHIFAVLAAGKLYIVDIM